MHFYVYFAFMNRQLNAPNSSRFTCFYSSLLSVHRDTKKMKTGVSSQKVLREVRRQQKDEENQELWERKRVSPLRIIMYTYSMQCDYV